jgi:hypothetical protein
MGGIFLHPHRTLRRNRVSASPLNGEANKVKSFRTSTPSSPGLSVKVRPITLTMYVHLAPKSGRYRTRTCDLHDVNVAL